MGLLDSFKGDGDVVREKQLSVKRDEALERTLENILKAYEAWLPMIGKVASVSKHEYRNALPLLSEIPLNHRAIEEFCLSMNGYQDKTCFERSGSFISALIQNAYHQGCNDFRIYTQNLQKKLHSIGAHICGNEDDSLRVIVDGDAGEWCGGYAERSSFTFNGDAGNWCGDGAEYSSFTFNGDAGWCCGEYAKHSSFTFNGDASYACGRWADHSSFTFNGNAGKWCGCNAENSHFHSSDKNILKKIKEYAEPSCRYFLINPDSTSKEVFR